MKIIDGGVCAAKGFTAGSIRSGIKDSRADDDTAIIFSACECTAAATYTMNRVKAAPLYVTMEHLENGVARAIVANAGNANACAPDGMENARRMAKVAAKVLGVDEDDVVVASTGVIGQRLPVECIEQHLPEIVLDGNGSEKANRAIMTTDTKTKTAAVEFTIGGRICRIGGICKGSGMIHPNMGTMLSFLTTDCCDHTRNAGTRRLQENVRRDLSTASRWTGTPPPTTCAAVLANGMAGNAADRRGRTRSIEAFCKALNEVNTRLARQIAADGEGATKLVTCTVKSAPLRGGGRAAGQGGRWAPTWSRRRCSARTPTGAACCARWATPRRDVPAGICVRGVRVRGGPRGCVRKGRGDRLLTRTLAKQVLSEERGYHSGGRGRGDRLRDRVGLRPDL